MDEQQQPEKVRLYLGLAMLDGNGGLAGIATQDCRVTREPEAAGEVADLAAKLTARDHRAGTLSKHLRYVVLSWQRYGAR